MIKIKLLKNLLEEVTKKYDELIEEKEKIIKQTYEKSIKDELTGLYNRHYTGERLDQEIERSLRENHPFSLVMIDLDNFKKINDKYGHLRGDEVLKTVSEVLKKSFRKYDIISRLGGDEFLILAFSNKRDIDKKLKQIREKIEAIFPEDDLSISYGILTIPDDIKDFEIFDLEKLKEKILNRVDLLMYKDKRERKKAR